MYTVPLFDTFIDLDSIEKEEEEIICQGRGRHLERRVPRLPHVAFIIKKKIEEDKLSKGKRKRGRGRASIFRPLPTSIEDPGRHEFFQDHNTSTSQSVFRETFEAAESYGYSLHGNDIAEQDGNGNVNSRCELRKQMDKINELRISKEMREKERLHHKVNFAEINRQMFSELASSIHDKAFHKPLKVMPLTISNLDKHEKDSEDVLKKAVTTSRNTVCYTVDEETPIYERYGVTHEDIWLLKENRFKIPDGVKQKVNVHNQLAKLADDLACEVVDRHTLGNHNENGNTSEPNINVDSEHKQNVNINVDSGNKQNVNPNVDSEHKQNVNVNVDPGNEQNVNVNVDSSHKQNVNYLKQLFDEDSWSNQKELSHCSNEEFKGTEDSDVEHLKEETELVNIDRGVGDEKSDDDVDIMKQKVNIAVGEHIIESSNYEIAEEQGSLTSNLYTDADITHVDTNRLPTTCYEFESSSQLTESGEMSLSDDNDMDVTVKYVKNTANLSKEAIENCGNIDQVKEHTSGTVKFKTKEVVQSETNTSSSKLTADSVSYTNEESKESIDSDLSNSKDALEDSDSPNTEDDILFTEKNNENKNKAKVLEHKAQSSISLMDEFDTPVKVESQNTKVINKDADRTLIADDLEGFQVVKKKHRKKRSVSPHQKKGKTQGKPDSTIWTLYGTNVIQVEGLPRDCDTSELRSMVNSFGTIQDSQVKAVNDNILIRFRLPDEDSCEYAVTCLDGAEDQNCVLTCFKLAY